jgi:competence protein ComEC
MTFLRRLQPQIAFVSAGRGNLFGHPAPDILARYSDLDTIVFRTDQDGAIVIDSDGREVDVQTISGRKWKVRVQRAP